MKVRYTNSWYDPDKEKEAAEKLIDEDKCKIISQHADSDGVPTTCENKGIPNVFYNSENLNLTKSYLISSRINWRPYFRYFIDNTLSKTTMEPDWTGHLKDGAVEVYNASSLAAEGTQDAVDQAIDDLKTGKINVFDTSKFTVDGKTLTSYKADVNTDPDSKKDTEVISNGIFQESHFRSSPYFDIIIDGIEEIKDKICFILLHDQTTSYDNNFIEAAKDVCQEKGVEAVLKTNIPETDECYNTAKDLAQSGCKAIFADSFGHEEHLLKAAKEFPEIQFGHATGTLAHTSNLTNFHNTFASIYEGRYVTGIAAGMKLNEMIDKKEIDKSQAIVGYVGAFPFAEVISG